MTTKREARDQQIASTPSKVFDREEGNMDPGIAGLPPVIAEGIANDAHARRGDSEAMPTARLSDARR